MHHLPWDTMDIEDLHKLSKEKKICPYFAMKDRVAGADLVFMPYNYLIDPRIRTNYEINLKNSIIIFDEAHNIAQTFEDSQSFTIDYETLDKVLIEFNALHTTLVEGKEKMETNIMHLENLQRMTKKFKEYLEDLDFENFEGKLEI